MPNISTPKVTVYTICRTSNKEHLDGFIALFDFENNTGIATVYVSESRPREPKPVWHVSSELIISDSSNKMWHTLKPHVRHNGDSQHWYFKEISSRSEGPPQIIDHRGGDNNKTYTKYIKYDFYDSDREPWTVSIDEKQGDGTGTGGNGETGN